VKRLETQDWWPDLLAAKDDLSLRELAERFGVTPGAISTALKRQGISRKPARPGPRSGRRASLVEAPAPTPTASRRSESSDKLVPFHDLLGTVPDDVVADKAGVSRRTVANYRGRHGITGYRGKRRRIKRTSAIDPFLTLLGTVPDHEIAERAGVSANAVRAYRVRRDIPSWRASKRSGAATPTPAAAAQPAAPAPAPTASSRKPTAPKALPTAVRVAWRVSLGDGRQAIVVATSLAEAAARSEREGEVQTLERLGSVLD
jgi:transcriptional regulator with XRE-family HTH domain